MDQMNDSFYTLITGASMGFGKVLALECARRNMNLIIVALPGESLHELAASIKKMHAVDVVAIEKDLCEDQGCQELFHEVNTLNLQVNMLINNAGVGSTELFHDGCIAQYEKQVRLNVLATTMITHLFLQMLKQNAPSYILNVGSLASFFSLQKKQVYGATKSFICYFSKSLRRELKKENVFVTVICPGGMFTNNNVTQTINTGNYISRLSSVRPEEVAPVAINGLLQKKEVIIPGRINKTLVFLDGVLPRFIVRFFEELTMKRLHTPTSNQEVKRKRKHTPVYTMAPVEN
jgi:uncharacterized protein